MATDKTKNRGKNVQEYVDRFLEYNRYDKYNNMKLKVLEPGHVLYTMSVLQDQLSSPATCHGGAIAGLMDSVLGVAALSYAFTLECLCATVEFKINYFNSPKSLDNLASIP